MCCYPVEGKTRMTSAFYFIKEYYTDGEQLFSISTEDWTEGNKSEVWLVRQRLNMKNSFLTARVVKYGTNSSEAL